MVNTQQISNEHIVSQGEGNIVSDMDGEKVMLSIENGKYYNLGEMGGVIWDLIQSPISINQLVNKLLDQYEVEKSKCEEEVITFLKTLHKEGLIKVEEA
ncbi:lasso peptide biosynthesis PqqD family chaperone [Metabacillus halosaccharovorans]|uniref:lasso peptide biosynthesis PqqD family chaperone n=1 Tax=Metabacillus halosaccharovorans TaxID=930124 RepID=UPI0034CEB849